MTTFLETICWLHYLLGETGWGRHSLRMCHGELTACCIHICKNCIHGPVPFAMVYIALQQWHLENTSKQLHFVPILWPSVILCNAYISPPTSPQKLTRPKHRQTTFNNKLFHWITETRLSSSVGRADSNIFRKWSVPCCQHISQGPWWLQCQSWEICRQKKLTLLSWLSNDVKLLPET